MKKIFFIPMVISFLLIGTNVFAADADLIVNGKVGVGTATPTSKMTVNGTIESTSGGIKFPDGTTQTTAAGSSSGKILQVLNITKTDPFNTNSGSYVSITGLSTTITPSSVNSKILITSNVSIGSDTSTANVRLQLLRGTTPICIGDADGPRERATISLRVPSDGQFTYAGIYIGSVSCLDSPNTTSPVTYSWQIKTNAGWAHINMGGVDPSNSDGQRVTSQITLMEVAP